jgi:SH3-like domain-containing protein
MALLSLLSVQERQAAFNARMEHFLRLVIDSCDLQWCNILQVHTAEHLHDSD